MENNKQDSFSNAYRFIRSLAAISLFTAPLLSLIGWGISHDSFSSLLNLGLLHRAANRAYYLTASSDPALIFRYFLLPHYFLYAAMPVYIFSALTIMYLTYKTTPWTSFLGAVLAIIGGVYFVGVLGAYLSAPIASVQMTGIISLSFLLCLLLFAGNILLGISLLKNKLNSKWTSLLFILGNALVLLFAGIENWMALGSLLMLAPMYQLSKLLLPKTK